MNQRTSVPMCVTHGHRQQCGGGLGVGRSREESQWGEKGDVCNTFYNKDKFFKKIPVRGGVMESSRMEAVIAQYGEASDAAESFPLRWLGCVSTLKREKGGNTAA